MKKIILKMNCMLLMMLMLFSTLFISVSAATWDPSLANSIFKQAKIDNLQAKSFVIMDFGTGLILQGKEEDTQFPLASMTKIMTLILIMDALESGTITLDTEITTSKNAQTLSEGATRVYIVKNEKFTVSSGLKAIAITSANDVAIAFSEHIGGTEAAFVGKMNEKAASIGLKNTNFLDCTGLTDIGHYSTSKDVAIMSKYLIEKHPEILEYTKIVYDTFSHGEGKADTMMSATDRLLKFYPGTDGLKTGHTEAAGYCQSATIEIEGRRIIAVVFGEPSDEVRAGELKMLMQYGLTEFEKTVIATKDTFVKDIDIKKGSEKRIKTSIASTLETIVRKDSDKNVTKELSWNENITAPIKKGDKVGQIVYKLDDKEIGKVDIVADQDMGKANWFVLFLRMILSWIGL